MNKPTRDALAALPLALGLLAWAAPAPAQDHVIRLLVPFAPGGGADTVARAVAKRMQTELGETVVVENKPGAGGNIAFDQVAASPPDGRMLGLATNSLVINPLLYTNVKFDPSKSFTPVGLLATSPVLVLGRQGLPFKTLDELMAYAKANPGKLSYASCGNGSIHQLAAESLKAAAGLNILHVAYKGCSTAMIDLAGGQVDLGFISLTSASSFIEGKRVVPFAVTRDTPSPFMPGLPTVASSGGPLARYSFDGWYALVAAAKTPPAVVKRLNDAINKSLADPEVQRTLVQGTLDAAPGQPSALAKLIDSETERYGKIIKAENIKGD